MSTHASSAAGARPASAAAPGAGEDKRQAHFELGAALLVYGWQALSLAVEGAWGGAESPEKRDWLVGLVVDQFPPLSPLSPLSPTTAGSGADAGAAAGGASSAARPQPQTQTQIHTQGAGASTSTSSSDKVASRVPEVDELADLLEDVLAEEFCTSIEDDSAEHLAKALLRCYADCENAQYAGVLQLQRSYEARSPTAAATARAAAKAAGGEDSSDDGSEEDDADGDAEMMDVDVTDGAGPSSRPEPVVDEDGFELVQKGRRRR